MLLSDLNGPRPLQPRRTGLGGILPSSLLTVRFATSAVLVLSSATFAATICRAQDQHQAVADAARQARAKKQEAHKSAKHVYTEEDLKRKSILTPEDRAQIEAKRNECAQKNNCSPVPAENSPAAVDANSETPATSLGEVARQYRKQKELQAQKRKELEAQKQLQAVKPKQSEPFHLPFSTPALASPILPERPVIQLPTAPDLRPRPSSRMTRRDPFSRGRITPEARRPEVPLAGIWQPKISPSENLRPKVHVKVRPPVIADPEPTRHEAPPAKVSIAVALAKVRPSFGQPVRPTVLAHPRVFARATPPVFSVHPALPKTFALPVPAEILARPAQPVVPVETVRPEQPAHSSPATPIASAKFVNVQPGDSLWKLAQQNLGSGRLWPNLVAVNPWIADPNQIRAGARVVLPAVTAAPRTTRSTTDSSTHIVKVRKGDTLWALAKANLGRSSAWPCVAAANPAVANPDRIFEGQELLLPTSCTTQTHSTLSPSNP